MTRQFFQTAAIAFLGMGLGGCASADGRYPSLAVRDAERTTGEFMPASPTPSAIPGVVSPQRVADLLSAAYDAQRKFEEARPEAERIVRSAQGMGAESDRRSRALIAVAELTSLRGETALVLSRLDVLEAEALTTFAPSEAIASGQAHIANLLRQQDETLDSLSEMLAQ
ncbi:MAG: hypothetical protein AAGI28_13485 [Pseudomonadota bacterium]